MRALFVTATFLALGITISAHAANCQKVVVPYATASTINICLSKYDSTNADDNEKVSLKADATFSAGDVKIQTDAGGEGNVATLPTDRGTCYSQPLSVGETTGQRFYLTYIDQDSTQVWVAHCVEGYTFGNASAFYPTADVNVVSASDTAEYTSVPTTGSEDLLTMVRVMYQLAVAKFQSTSSEQTWYRSDGSTVWTTKDIADDGTNATRTAHEADD